MLNESMVMHCMNSGFSTLFVDSTNLVSREVHLPVTFPLLLVANILQKNPNFDEFIET